MRISKYILFLFLSVAALLPLWSQEDELPDKPNPPQLVNNYSKEFPDFLSSQEQSALEQKLQAFSNATSNQIVVVIVDDMNGLTAVEFATRLGVKWGVGQEKFKNGVVILVKPTGGEGQRDVFIAVGYGLEGAIPDIKAKHIVRDEIIPRFKNGQMYEALDAATDALMALAKPEYNVPQRKRPGAGKTPIPVAILVLIVLFVIIMRFKRRGFGGFSHGGYYGGSGWGGGFGGGSSGGGFGGFGGGSFGGGGAGGKW